MPRSPSDGALPRCGAGDLRAEERQGGPDVPKHFMDMSLMTQIHPRQGQRDAGSARCRTAASRPGLMSDRERATTRTRDSKFRERDDATRARPLGNRHVADWRVGWALPCCPAKATDDDHDRLSFSGQRDPSMRQEKSPSWGAT